MAGIFTRFTLRSLAQNRVRTAVTVVGIALSTALLAAVLTSVASVQQGLLERTMVTEGSWHVYSPDVPAQGIDALVESDADPTSPPSATSDRPHSRPTTPTVWVRSSR